MALLPDARPHCRIDRDARLRARLKARPPTATQWFRHADRGPRASRRFGTALKGGTGPPRTVGTSRRADRARPVARARGCVAPSAVGEPRGQLPRSRATPVRQRREPRDSGRLGCAGRGDRHLDASRRAPPHRGGTYRADRGLRPAAVLGMADVPSLVARCRLRGPAHGDLAGEGLCRRRGLRADDDRRGLLVGVGRSGDPRLSPRRGARRPQHHRGRRMGGATGRRRADPHPAACLASR